MVVDGGSPHGLAFPICPFVQEAAGETKQLTRKEAKGIRVAWVAGYVSWPEPEQQVANCPALGFTFWRGFASLVFGMLDFRHLAAARGSNAQSSLLAQANKDHQEKSGVVE